MCRKVLIRNLNENKTRACESLLEKNDRRFTRNALAMLLSPYKTAVCRYFFDMPLSTVCHCICTAKCRRVLLHLRRLVPPCATKLISVPTCPALCNHYKIKRGTRPYMLLPSFLFILIFVLSRVILMKDDQENNNKNKQ